MAKQKSLHDRIEKLMPKLRPLEKHILNQHDEYVKERYLVLLSGIALEDGQMGEKELRFMQALGNGIGMEDVQKYISQADKLDDTVLEETFKSLRDNNLAAWFLLDSMMLARIDAPLTEPESRLLGILGDGLKMEKQLIQTCVDLAWAILGQETEEAIKAIMTRPHDLPPLSIYDTYMSLWLTARPLTVADVDPKKPLSGKFLVLNKLAIKGEMSIQDAELEFQGDGEFFLEQDATLTITNSKLVQSHISSRWTCTIQLTGNTFQNGKGLTLGENAALNVSECRFENTPVEMQKSAAVTIEKSLFLDVRDQTALYFDHCGSASLTDTRFQNCGYSVEAEQKYGPGAILSDATSLTLKNCSFEKCTTSGDGGAVYHKNATLAIDKCTFDQCQAGREGGGLSVHGGTETMNVTNTRFLQCSAGQDGGGFISYCKAYRMKSCEMNKCSATSRGGGGALMDQYGDKTDNKRIHQCRFVECTAKEGNGLWIYLSAGYHYPNHHSVWSSTFVKCGVHENSRTGEKDTAFSRSEYNNTHIA